MKIDYLNTKFRGWFCGDFPLATFRTAAFEAAVMHYQAGDREDWHVHRIATEINVVVEGHVQFDIGPKEGLRRKVYVGPGTIVQIDPGEGTDFEAVTNAVVVVVKSPSVPSDKSYA